MANINFRSGQEITSGDTSDNTLVLTGNNLPGGAGPFVCEIKVTSGTIKFANNGDPTGNYGYTSADGFFHMAHSPTSPLHYLAAGAADKFVINVLG